MHMKPKTLDRGGSGEEGEYSMGMAPRDEKEIQDELCKVAYCLNPEIDLPETRDYLNYVTKRYDAVD